MTSSLADFYAETTPEQREARYSRAMRLTTLEPLPTNRNIPPLVEPEWPQDSRPWASSREPCSKCGARGDFGCVHQRPYVPESISSPAGECQHG